MACSNSLRQDIDNIRSTFSNLHPRFQTTSASLDKLKFEFIDASGRKYKICASIPGDYPKTSPVWYSKTEKIEVLDAIRSLNNTFNPENNIISQVTTVIKELCRLHSVPEPADIINLTPATPSTSNFDWNVVAPVVVRPKEDQIDDDEEDDSDDFVEHDDNILFEEIPVEKKEIDESTIDPSTESIKDKLSQMKLMPQCNKRLIHDLIEVFDSEYFKNNTYSFEPKDDDFINWQLGIRAINSNSQLGEDLERIKKNGQDCILLLINFKNFPWRPPSVRVSKPVLRWEFVEPNGDVKIKALMAADWSVTTSISQLFQVITEKMGAQARIAHLTFAALEHRNVETEYNDETAVISLD